jgi:ferric-dicitrate binding protein FerR (iron transport regulator)
VTERPGDDVRDLLRLAGPRAPVAGDAAARVHDAVRERWRRARAARRRYRWVAVGLAVAAAAVWLRPAGVPRGPSAHAAPRAGVVERVNGSGLSAAGAPAAAGTPVPAGAWLETLPDTRAALRATSGASVRLDAGTRLRVLSASALRLDRGAVYVDTDGTASTLRVHTADGEVHDVGTQFQVRYAAPATQVIVRTGAVVVRLGTGTHPAGAGVALDVTGGRVERSAVAPYGPSWAWVEAAAPEYALDGRTLADFLQWAARETGLALRYDDPGGERAAAAVRLHGSTRGLTPSEALQAVLPASDFESRREGGTLRVARAAR